MTITERQTTFMLWQRCEATARAAISDKTNTLALEAPTVAQTSRSTMVGNTVERRSAFVRKAGSLRPALNITLHSPCQSAFYIVLGIQVSM